MNPQSVVTYGVAALNSTRIHSPVALNQEWPHLGRLLAVVIFVTVGTILNGFFVAAFFIEDALRRIGHVFLACVGLADLMVTTGAMPMSAVVLLSGQWDNTEVCKMMQFIIETSIYSYSLFFTLVSLDTYYRFSKSSAEYDESITSIRACLVTIFVFAVSFLLAGLGVYLELDYDYCHRVYSGNFYFRTTTSILFQAIPFVVTVYCLISASLRIHYRAEGHFHYRRSLLYQQDSSANTMNMTAYFIYVLAWLPYLVIIHKYPNTPDNKYYNSVWIAVCRSVITSFLYGTLDRTFRRAFGHLFCYCFCKMSLPSSYNTRHRRGPNYRNKAYDVRVHILHQAVNTSSPYRPTTVHRAMIHETPNL